MVGGVLATLQPKELEAATHIKPYVGLLNKPGVIDVNNTIIIDTLPLDYSILEEIDYKYDMANAYYGSMTKGCVRRCAFCAVPKIEPVYQDFISISERVSRVKSMYGEQKDLLLMDNNVLASDRFEEIIEDIIKAGFGVGATFTQPNQLDLAINDNLKKEGANDRAYLRERLNENICHFCPQSKTRIYLIKCIPYCMTEVYCLLAQVLKANAILAYQDIAEDYAALP
ncbi:MAG: hypothetical protein ACLR8Y_09970 [Alistipes indistinctus]